MSTVFRVQKNANYTTMSNYHLKDKRLSYKAKGLLSVILSLPDEWDYSLKGLACISNDGVDSVRSTVKELEKFGYISRGAQTRDERGRMSANEYFVYENPGQNPFFTSEKEFTALENPTRSNSDKSTALDFPITDNPITEKPSTVSFNNKILNNQVLNNQSIHQSNEMDRIDENNVRKNFSFSGLKEKIPDNGSAEREKYLELIHENIDYDLFADYKRSRVDEFCEIMLDVICSKSDTVRVNGSDIPREAAKSRFLKLTFEHIEYVMEALDRCAPEIHNIRAYLITALYNAPVTQDNYYSAMACNDMRNGKI